MADFDIAFKRLAKIEGGYSDNPSDNGNWTGGKQGVGHLVGTNYGITACDYADFIGHTPSAQEMRDMPFEHAEEIYKKVYWPAMRGDEIENQEEATDILDFDVNSGIKNAIMKAQIVLGLPQTGIMSNETLKHLNNKI